MKSVDCRLDSVYEPNPNSELWDNVFVTSLEKRVPAKTVYVWFVNDESAECNEKSDEQVY